ncbi:MAG: hypothetical protein RL757_2859 [Bacteroidota bacterium]|jgi:hypothetical protein
MDKKNKKRSFLFKRNFAFLYFLKKYFLAACNAKVSLLMTKKVKIKEKPICTL